MNGERLPHNVLTSEEILERIEAGDLGFRPGLDSFQIQPTSVDLRLGFTFMIPKTWEMTARGREAIRLDYMADKSNFTVIELEPGQFFDILPGEYIIFSTLEQVQLPDDIIAILYPRSSVNRRGISVDLSGIIDAGYHGHLIIPIRNNTGSQVIRVYPGERLCQLVFHSLWTDVETKRSRFHRKDVATAIGSQKEASEEEMQLVKSGQIRRLKEKHAISRE